MQKEKYIYAKHLIGKSFTTSLFVWLTMVSLDFAVSFVSELENLSKQEGKELVRKKALEESQDYDI